MENKFKLTSEENVFIARRNMVDYIFNIAKLEGMETTYLQVQIIVDGNTVKGLSVDDTIVIHNLKRAWEFILTPKTLSLSADFDLAYRINDILSGGYGIVKTHGNEDHNSLFESIPQTLNATERAIKVLIFIIISNMLTNRNLAAGTILANQIMIANGAGIITIPINLQVDFFANFDKYYYTNDNKELMEFLYKNCIDGIHLNGDRS